MKKVTGLLIIVALALMVKAQEDGYRLEAVKAVKTVSLPMAEKPGQLRMPMAYTDSMVLQRDCRLHIHGEAAAGAMVTVSIAGHCREARAGNDGHWEVSLPPLQAGGPYTLTVTDGVYRLQYKDVLAGEVWLCSGQSNMAFMLRNAIDAQNDIRQATNDRIRLFDMKPSRPLNSVEWESDFLDSVNNLQYYACTKWRTASPQSVEDFSAVAYYFGKMLQDSLKVPVGLICNAIGGSPTEAWIDRETLQRQFPVILKDWMHNELIQDWVRGKAIRNLGKAENKSQRHPFEPCYLFEAGILPLEQFPLKGVIWYQGESNAHNVAAHETLFTLLVKSWRRNWSNDNLPFYYVQLSSMDRPSWPQFRDSQRRLMGKIKNTGVVVSSDQGDSLDVHPKNKKPVGERLAYWALSKTYGWKWIVPSGPLLRNAEFRNGFVYVTFDYGEGLHAADGKPLRAFEVAGVGGKFEPAVAEIEGNSLKVYSDKVKNPRYIRYAWQPFTRANLVNGAGPPASTFIASRGGAEE